LAGGEQRNSKLNRGRGFEIIQAARNKLIIKAVEESSEMLCVATCGLDLDCFLTIYSSRKCELYRKEAQDYFNITQTDLSIYYKKDMLNQPLYIAKGEMSFMKCHNS